MGKRGKEGRLHFSEFCLRDSIEEVVDQVLNIITFQIKHRVLGDNCRDNESSGEFN